MSITVQAEPKKQHRSLSDKKLEAITGYLFILPTVLGFVVFTLGPIIATFYFSLTKYNMLKPPQYIGIENYVDMLADLRLLEVSRNTMVFSVSAVSLTIVFGLLMAVALNQNLLLPSFIQNIFRSVYFFPILVAMIYVAMIWQFWFHKDLGVINYYLGLLHIEPIRWLGSSQWALVSIIIVYVWKNVGFSMLIFLTGLQNINKDYYEAAELDGAGSLQKFFGITLPLLSPTLLFTMIINSINAFQEFDSMIVLTGGGPGDASRSLVLYIYEKAFRSFDMGYASALAMVLFLVIMILTLVQLKLSQKWVHYE
ncbi:MAG: sugar ABC transporter permease [Anaerolineae bacterium]|nr:sugar ABC transporter permease [Anaerolineae bacterium]